MISFSDRKSLLGKFNGEACLTHHIGIQKAIKILESEKIESEILQWDSHHENHKYEKIVFCDLEDYSDLRVDFIEEGFHLRGLPALFRIGRFSVSTTLLF